MRVLVVNAGSSSLKLALLEDQRTVEATKVERWDGHGHVGPIREFVEGAGQVDAVGHRVVHGGPRFTESAEIDEDLLDYLDSIEDLAPLHNPRALAGMRAMAQVVPDAPGVACFDTTFHSDLPERARTYALPREWNERWGLRRYGFHGISHAYAVRRAAELIHRDLPDLRVVSCHLGAGASLAAVVEGRSVDTTMGFTPLEGLVMATRSGTVDPGLLLWLMEHHGVTLAELSDALDTRSGLKGLSGHGDLRDVLAEHENGEAGAILAFDVFTHRLRREIGAMAASAEGLDLLVFTGGIGEHSPEVRTATADGLAHLGVAVDADANANTHGDRDISTTDATTRTIVVSASEESEIARETERVLG